METDYLVIGAGALGWGSIDTLIGLSDADIIIIDRGTARCALAHSYPFARLHQPSMVYGVVSTSLGSGPDSNSRGGNTGSMSGRAEPKSAAYYDEIMRHRFLPSGRVRFFPMCDFLGVADFVSPTGAETEVMVRRSVDAT